MKKNIILSMMLMLSTTLFSQKTFFSLGAEVAFPGSSGLNRNAKMGVGGSIRVESSFGKHIAGIATLGYLGFGEKELAYSGTPPTITKVKAIPIQIGIKYYMMEVKEVPKGFFLSAELGLMPTTTHFDYAVNADRDFKESGICTALGLGYQCGKIETGFRLQQNLTVSGFDIYYFNFRVAYCFLKAKIKQGNKR